MPSRAFYDLELKVFASDTNNILEVLMPSRAFYDLEHSSPLQRLALGHWS